MRRIILLLTVAALLVAMIAVSAIPAAAITDGEGEDIEGLSPPPLLAADEADCEGLSPPPLLPAPPPPEQPAEGAGDLKLDFGEDISNACEQAVNQT
jgi:hypothetical protein